MCSDFRSVFWPAVFTAAALALLVACSTQKKLAKLNKGEAELPTLMGKDTTSLVPQFDQTKAFRDTLKVIDDETGKELVFMKTLIDEKTGEAVASDVLEASTIIARFRNIAERNGEVDLYFDIIVPASVRDSRWQVQLFPTLYAMGDSLRLAPVIITGAEYRKQQLKGYEQYERLVASLKAGHYYEKRNFEVFLARNLPQVYSLRTDTTVVSDEAFRTLYGLTQQEILDHYTHKQHKVGARRMARLTRMHDSMKVFFEKDGTAFRLDTVLVDDKGTFTYEYMHTIRTRKGMRKVDFVLSGDILEKGDVVYRIPPSEPFSFYISSTSTLYSPEEKYLKKVLERRVAANMSISVDFAAGSAKINESRAENRAQLHNAKKIFSSLLQDKVYDMDSIIIMAYCSPEGKVSVNDELSLERGTNIAQYFTDYVVAQQDSLDAAMGMVMDESGHLRSMHRSSVPFISHSVGEDWLSLDSMVARDSVLTDEQKAEYMRLKNEKDLDWRERKLRRTDIYQYIRETYYPRLRRVDFEFYLHRKGMVKDTVETTVIDSTYMRGVEALRDMEYQTAADILAPYRDYNAAVAAVGADRNYFALEILNKLDATPQVHYMLAIVHARLGDEGKAVRHYMTACKMDHSLVFRGNLDPEISRLIKAYGLNKEEEDDFDL